MKMTRNCQMPYPVYQTGGMMPNMMNPGMMPNMMNPGMMGMNMGPNMMNSGMVTTNTNTNTMGITEQLMSMQDAINNIENRLSKLEMAKNNNNSSKYNDSNYYML